MSRNIKRCGEDLPKWHDNVLIAFCLAKAQKINVCNRLYQFFVIVSEFDLKDVKNKNPLFI